MTNDSEPPRADQFSTVLPQRGRPWLMPYNRKLRHLQGISIRNLTLDHGPVRARGKTMDDDAIPSNLKSPAKVLALREEKRLEHSRSSTDLRLSEDGAQGQVNGAGEDIMSLHSPSRPSLIRMRRRSTMEWSGTSPLERQHKLEDVTTARLADTFFSLHVKGQEEPVYVSEVVEKAMNPSFRFFDLGTCGPTVTRLDTLTVKVWTKFDNAKSYQYLIGFTANLRYLQFVGKSLEAFHHPLPENCILFHLADGIYTSFTDLASDDESSFPVARPNTASNRTLPTSSYDALMRLSTLDDCIQDALSTRERIANEISTILTANEDVLALTTAVPEAEEFHRTVRSAITSQKRALLASRRRKAELEASLASRRAAMDAGRTAQAVAQAAIEVEKSTTLRAQKDSLAAIRKDIAGQRRRICTELLEIYPLEPLQQNASDSPTAIKKISSVSADPLAFTIRNLHLPNSPLDDRSPSDDQVLAAALGYAAHLTSLAALYLGISLPYPLHPRNSTSTIDDPISLTVNQTQRGSGSSTTTISTNLRTHPLFPKGVPRFRFEYGVFLLNKDVECLAGWVGLRVVDVRTTLPNLAGALWVLTAGEGEVPRRVPGRVGGLHAGRVLLRTGGSGGGEEGEGQGQEALKMTARGTLGLLGGRRGIV